jgi:hypothetical protein
MPIRPENKALYPENWKEISYRIRVERAKNRCEKCGIINHSVIRRLPDGTCRRPTAVDWDMIYSRIRYCHSNMTESLKRHGFTKIVLTVAHLDHNPANCSDDNLRALCQKCHLGYDMDRHISNRKKTMNERLYKGQLKLF